LLTADLITVSGVVGLDRASVREHVLDLLVRDHDRPRAIGEDVVPGHHPHPREDDRNVGLERRHLPSSPLRRFARAVCREVVAGELVEVPQPEAYEVAGVELPTEEAAEEAKAAASP
jgi:hypothetical protein